MARRIHNVDFDIIIIGSGIFGEDRDSAFPFEVAGIHDSVRHHLIIAEASALLKHFVHKRRLAVVYVCDNRNIS